MQARPPAVEPIAPAAVPQAIAERLRSHARLRAFGRDEIVFLEGDAGDSIHLVTRGRFAASVSTMEGQTIALALYGEGDLFGEVGLLGTTGRRVVSVASLERGETAVVPRAALTRLRRDHPDMNDFLIGVLAERMDRYGRLLQEALSVPAEQRILRRIVDLHRAYGDRQEIPLTQSTLANFAGTSRATVNRVLGNEVARGTIVLRRAAFTVVKPELLERRARLQAAG